MRLNRNADQWREIEETLNHCERAVAVFEAFQDRLKELLPELSEDFVIDLSNGVVTLQDFIEGTNGTVFEPRYEGKTITS